MEVQETIKTKHAVRLFSETPVPDDVIHTILDAGRRSQSSKNTQPWQFVVVRDRDALTALSKTGDYAGHLAGAAFAVALIGEADSAWNMFDLGQAAAYMQLVAWAEGVGSCIAAIYHPDDAKAILRVPANKTFYAALSFGYPSPEHVTAKMGGRKPIDEIVHWEHW